MEWKDALWDRYAIAAPRTITRQALFAEKMPEGHARHQSCNTPIHCPAGHCAAMSREGQTSNAELGRELEINPKTVAKWRKRQSVEDRKTGPREPRSTVFSEEDEAVIVAFRRHTLLPLDDCLYALQPTIPHLTRSSLHRCLQRQGRRLFVEAKSRLGPGAR